MVLKKRLVFVTLILGTIALLFFMGSRYPQLNEKALMGGTTGISGLSFDVVVPVFPTDPYWKKIGLNTINWLETNKKGMTFGLLFAPALMMLLSQVDLSNVRNRLGNAMLGTIMGAPLGVCVNCAAPIGKGVFTASNRLELGLATMISSPTLNVVILSMLFALFPPYLIALKLGLTFITLMVIIPVICHLFDKGGKFHLNSVNTKSADLKHIFTGLEPGENPIESWIQALKWTLSTYLKFLWFIIKKTVPLMILAGILGNVVISFVSFDEFIYVLHGLGPLKTIAAMLALAVVATFFPVPIAFDIILVAILLNASIQMKFAMVMLFCLGTFSVYAWFIIGQSTSYKLASALFISISMLGVGGGVFAHYMEKHFTVSTLNSVFAELPSYKGNVHRLTYEPNFQSDQKLEVKAVSYTPLSHGDASIPSNIVLESDELITRIKAAGKFKGMDGENIGILSPYRFDVATLFTPYSRGRSLAASDYQKDGWIDIACASTGDVQLFTNLGNGQFHTSPLISDSSLYFINVTWVDMNEDSWPDLFLSSFNQGNFVLWNNSGVMSGQPEPIVFKGTNFTYTEATAFGDLDLDGHLDIFLGNHTIGAMTPPGVSYVPSQNYIAYKRGNEYQVDTTRGFQGETLSTLIADINMDQYPDILVANDFETPDQFFISNNSVDRLLLKEHPNFVLPYSTETTMSLSIGDINNDLVPELYIAQVSNAPNVELNQKKILDTTDFVFLNRNHWGHVEAMNKMASQMSNAYIRRNFSQCPENFEADCATYFLLMELGKKRNRNQYYGDLLSQLPSQFKVMDMIAKFDSTPRFDVSLEEKYAAFQQKPTSTGSVLYQSQDGNKWVDKVKELGVEEVGWAWNSNFTDFDNDGYLDLHVSNGLLPMMTQVTNLLFINEGGEELIDKTRELGVTNFFSTSSSLFLDYDRDGDMDLINGTTLGPIQVFNNQINLNTAIRFLLVDEKYPSMGIGSKIYIYYGNDEKQYREITLSGGFKSYNPLEAHFGLGELTHVDRVEVLWADGEKTSIGIKLATNKEYRITRKKR